MFHPSQSNYFVEEYKMRVLPKIFIGQQPVVVSNV